MHGDAAASGAMGVDQLIDRTFDSCGGEGIHHDLPLPGAIGRWLPVLYGAAAAGAEISAERQDPLRAGDCDAEQRRTVGLAGDRLGFDGLISQRVRYEHASAAA